MVRIPVEYQEVEYLESSGEEYIITDKYLSEDVIVEFKYTYLAYGQRYAAMFGAITNSSSNPAFVMFRDSNGVGKVAGRFGKWTDSSNNYIDTNVTYSYGDILEGKCGINWIEYNGTRYTSGLVWDNALSNANIGLFCRAINGSVFTNSLAVGRIYYLRFYNASELVANLIPCYRKSDSEPGMYDTVTKQFFTNAGTGEFIVGNDVSWDTASLIERRRQMLLNTPHLETISDNIASFKTDVPAPVKDCKVYFEPVQEGSGDPSPDNVRPISGWDGVSVYKTGKNLLVKDEITFTTNKYIKSDGSIGDSSYYKLSNMISCKHLTGKTITANALVNAGGTSVKSLAFYLSDEVSSDTCVLAVHKATALVKYVTFNVPSTAKYMLMCLNKSTTLDDKYIVEGTEPPNEVDTPTAITLPFPQTIYGGYVDLVKGEVVETWVCTYMNAYKWKYIASTKRFESQYLDRASKTAGLVTVLSDVYNGIENASGASFNSDAPDKSMCFNTSSGRPYVILKDSDYTDAESFKASLSGHKLTYKLATPNTYQLDPETIKTLKGVNNIWSNANGNIEVKFWKH